MTPAQRKRQFSRLEKKIAFARKGQKRILQRAIYAERLSDLRAVAERVGTEPAQS